MVIAKVITAIEIPKRSISGLLKKIEKIIEERRKREIIPLSSPQIAHIKATKLIPNKERRTGEELK